VDFWPIRTEIDPQAIVDILLKFHNDKCNHAWSPAGTLARGGKVYVTIHSSPLLPPPFPPALSNRPFLLCCQADPLNPARISVGAL